MKHTNSDLFVIRGNHDKPIYFDGTTVLSNVTLLKDYTVVNINGWNILGVGGATSVDRVKRKGYWYPKKNDYWADEIFILNEDILNELRDIDIVVTHSAPNFCNPLTKVGMEQWIPDDKNLEIDVTFERHQLTIMYNILSENNNISEWYYGHFHHNTKTYYGNTVFQCLGIDNLVQSNKLYNYGEEIN
jgi:DNA repair exonuclease SbcCD nuclease subunit